MSAHSFDAQGQHCPFIPVFGAPQVAAWRTRASLHIAAIGTAWPTNGVASHGIARFT